MRRLEELCVEEQRERQRLESKFSTTSLQVDDHSEGLHVLMDMMEGRAVEEVSAQVRELAEFTGTTLSMSPVHRVYVLCTECTC